MINSGYQKLIDKTANVKERELLKREQWGVTKLFNVPGKRISFSEFKMVCDMINRDLIMSKVYLNEIGIIKVDLKSNAHGNMHKSIIILADPGVLFMNNPETEINKIVIYEKDNEFEKYNSPTAYVQQGNSYLSGFKPKEAIRAYKSALKIKPEHALITFMLGAAYFYDGQRALSLEVIKKAVELERNSEQRKKLQKNLQLLLNISKYNNVTFDIPESRPYYINTKSGRHLVYNNKFTQITNGHLVRYYMGLSFPSDLSVAREIRDKYFPKQSEIPRFTYFQIWTLRDDIIARDSKGDYEDVISE